MELVLAIPGGGSATNAATSSAKVKVSPITFGREYNEPLIHQVVTAYMAGGRAGTKAQKTRTEVSGGGAKPWKQKGTGRARAGSSNSPVWVGGGRAFAAKPRDFQQKVNKKMYRGALQSILSELVRQDRLMVIKHDDIKLDMPKTKDFLKKLDAYGDREQGALLILSDWDVNIYLAARNVPKVEVRDVRSINPVSLIKHKRVMITEDAIRKIEEVLG